ncbi:hypothetical protein H6P81_011177 [Aristolochia fimbriata]|uniref:Protein kinase domain-containing protein n=1 Tax=Aristolochia fimbriata TaxID=158543 RepID=A0AAV7EU96_ARIFI|nr:hypothetical protein H6P81_011177 [Aristolochia fimbriata]
MNYADRISNQMTIYYSQGRYNPRLCKRLPSADGFFPKSMRNKGEEESANEWVARTCSEPSRASVSAATATDRATGNSHSAVFFQRSLIDSQAEKFKFCLVGKFSQWRPSLSQIRALVSRKWKLQGHCSVTLLDHRHVLIRLDSEEDMIHVWTRNRWVIGGHLMRVFKWFPTFVPSKEEPSSAAVWVSLPSLPLVFFQEELLFPIASLAGRVIAVDDSTRNLSRTNVARVCVEVDLLKEPPRRGWVGIGEEGFWQDMCYQRLPPYCINCREQGHSSKTCRVHINSDCDTSTGMSDSKPCSGIDRESRRPEDFFDRTKRHRISSVVEDGEGSGNPTQLGLLLAEKEKGKEIAQEIVEGEANSLSDSSRSCSSCETQGGTWNREGCSPATTELNLPVEKSNGTPDAEICGSEKSGFSVSTTRQKFVLRRLMLFLGRSKQKELILPSLPFSNVVKFNYSEIKKMAKLGDKLGESSVGTVFMGKFQEDQQVAVRVLKQSRFEGDEEFARELRVLTRTSHANIIRLLGFCSQGSKRVLVYELMKGDLTQITSSKESVIQSQRLFEIALDIARGVEYLHQELDPALLRLRVNPATILLDGELRPKLCCFGLSPDCPTLDKYAGDTVGQYASPELSRAADVYGYGIILLEMALGRNARNRQEEIPDDVFIHKWVRRRVAAMGGLQGIALDEIQRKMVIVALWCTQQDPALRPSFTSVIAMLQASIDDLYLPHLPGNGVEV